MEPILRDIPEELSTDRLLLRAPRIGDSAIINPAIVETAEDLAMWMPEWAIPTPKVDDTEKWVRSAVAKFIAREQFHFLIFLREPHTYLGTGGLHHINWKHPAAEIGYWLRKSQWGRGYMAEAVGAYAKFALETLKCLRVEIKCDNLNNRSRRVAERAGFTLEGTLRNIARREDDLRHVCIYSKIPGDA